MRRRRRSAAADDAAVIEGCLSEPEQFAILFDKHAPHIYRYLVRRADRQVADDLVAETFLAAFAERYRYDLSYADARPWLYGIATDLVSQHRREEARQERIRQAAALEPEVPGHADQVAADVTAQAMHSLLDKALGALPAGDRDVLLLIAYEQLTYQEVSRALAIPVGTVRSRLHRARTSLHRARTQLRRALAGTDAAATYKELTANE
jgi:RNA polymerase sigma factor (sigma-70 family)